MQHRGISIQRRIREPDRALPRLQPLLINAIDQRREHRTRRARAPNQRLLAPDKHHDVVPHGRDVRDPAPDAVVAAVPEGEVEVAVGRVRRVVRGEEGAHGAGLVARDRVDVAEAAAGAEARGGDFGVASRGGAGGEGRAADVGDVGARVRVRGAEDGFFRAQAAVVGAVARGGADDTVVA